MSNKRNIFVGKNLFQSNSKNRIEGDMKVIDGENYFMIANVDSMPPFFMSIVSDANHWMFISSNGGLTAGRQNSEFSLFPYYTDDKITESSEITGSKSLFLIHEGEKTFLWEPFSDRYKGVYRISRNLYKSIYGNKILFEEINHDLDLSYSYQWNSSNLYGFVRKSKLINNSTQNCKISVLDGIQNIMPYGVPSDLQNSTSNLVDAYKRNELVLESGLGIFALSAIITDKAEPSEALKANIAWSLGFDKPIHLLTSLQLDDFRNGQPLQEEVDVKSEKGAYFVNTELLLPANSEKEWMIVAEVNQNQSSVVSISDKINSESDLYRNILADIDAGTNRLIQLVSSADGLQQTADKQRVARHFSNTLFNIMRGGVFDDNYFVEKDDFTRYLSRANQLIYDKYQQELAKLATKFDHSTLLQFASLSNDVDLIRLSTEYLPLKFSRRHGDPSRPWNKFSINTQSESDGSKILDYEGNWRDIFQNWEALSLSYPAFLESMIFKFLNATTFDGYNPYRVTKSGFDWETIEPDNPWSYIGYWGDHQIVYLLKLLELLHRYYPQSMSRLFNKQVFVYANVPYKIKSYQAIVANPKSTIDFDFKEDKVIRANRNKIGADGALLQDGESEIVHVSFIEKILATALAKLSNFIPEGGIWMNTQRPEWNDANNALVGNGVSVVTLCYLNRFLYFVTDLLENVSEEHFSVSIELYTFFRKLTQAFDESQYLLTSHISDSMRKQLADKLGQAGSDYRESIYKASFSGKKYDLSRIELIRQIKLIVRYLEHSIAGNRREDNLYHSYNILTINSKDNSMSISHLSEMLEGQVAVLSSGYLSMQERLTLLDSLKLSRLYRKDQASYILYPNKELLGFLQKNNLDSAVVKQFRLLSILVESDDKSILEEDCRGHFHFNGNFRNANDLKRSLEAINDPELQKLVHEEKDFILAAFENVFSHKSFTGRSGTFFGYEGLGSIYWHMVSKLQLAVFESLEHALGQNSSSEIVARFKQHYFEINEGIGVHKSPSVYGAFPVDPYSHTPVGKGAKQPGMTGQVKEDIICRFGELGVAVTNGELTFNPQLLRPEEYLAVETHFDYVDVNGEKKKLQLKAGSLVFTYCQIPVVYHLSKQNQLQLHFKDKRTQTIAGFQINSDISDLIFSRVGEIEMIELYIQQNQNNL